MSRTLNRKNRRHKIMRRWRELRALPVGSTVYLPIGLRPHFGPHLIIEAFIDGDGMDRRAVVVTDGHQSINIWAATLLSSRLSPTPHEGDIAKLLQEVI